MSSEDARKRWELENEIDTDSVFEYSNKLGENEPKPWLQDPQCFKFVKMSTVALLKIIEHADASKKSDVWGLIKGYYTADTIVVLDAIQLPATVDDNSDDLLKQIVAEAGDLLVGWYKSHPDYGLYLGRIEQQEAKAFKQPALAIIVDPIKTSSAGKVSIAAFRSCPRDESSLYSQEYYALKMSFFKSALDSKLIDLFWNKYWGARLIESDLLFNNRFAADKIENIANMTEQAEDNVEKSIHLEQTDSKPSSARSISWGATETSAETSVDQINGILVESVKLLMFSSHNNAEK